MATITSEITIYDSLAGGLILTAGERDSQPASRASGTRTGTIRIWDSTGAAAPARPTTGQLWP